MHRKTWALLLVSALTGCLWTPAPSPTVPRPIAASAAASVTGQVDMAALGRGTQASMGTLAANATVSLIDPATNQTVASAVTDASGRFTLNYAFTPNAAPYYLEAAKSLGPLGLGKPVARIRTLIQAQGMSWLSLTNGMAGPVGLNAATTALCAVTSLKQALPAGQQVSPASLIGKLTNGAPDGFTPVANCTLGEYQSALAVVKSALEQDLDPFAAIGYDTANAAFLLTGGSLAITSSSNLLGLMEGTSITLTGTGFDAVPTYNTVKFNGVPGVVTSASPTQLTVSVRGLTTGGNITVQVGSLVYQGPSYTVLPFGVNDGTTSVGVDNAYQYSPITAGAGYLYANWTSNPNATNYLIKIGTSPFGSDLLSERNTGATTTFTANNLTLQGAWASMSYYVTVTPVFGSAMGTPVTSNGIQVAEAAFWDGLTTTGVRNDSQGGYSTNFPAGSNKTQFYGRHYFETVLIPVGTTTYVQPFGKVDGISEAASIFDLRVRNPKDGWLALYANTLTVNGTIDASGRGYGGGPGTSHAGVAYHGHGGAAGLSGNGGSGNGGQGLGAAGGGGLSAFAGGRGGYFGGAGGGGADTGVGAAGNDSTAAGGGASAGATWNGCGSVSSIAGGAPPYGGGISFAYDNTGGTGGAGYGAGGGGAGGSYGLGSGGGGGTGGGMVGSATTGLGWAPGSLPMDSNSAAGVAGRYKAAPDTTTDASWVLGSGGSGGNAGYTPGLSQYTAGGGGGAGGGAIILTAASLNLGFSSRLLAVGAAGGSGGANDSPGAGGGGGGAGGTVVLSGFAINGRADVDVRGGLDGSPGNTTPAGCGSYAGGNGGSGGACTTNGGTIKVFYHSFRGTPPNPSLAGRIYYAMY